MSWTDDRVALLKKLWGEGKTAAEIAKALGGVTRNAVIGKAHRLKLSNRLSPIQQNKKPLKKPANTSRAPEKKPQPPQNPLPDDEQARGKKLIDLKANECRWPYGDPQHADFGFCGERVIAGLPYCPECVSKAYQPATRNKILKAEKNAEMEVEKAKKAASS